MIIFIFVALNILLAVGLALLIHRWLTSTAKTDISTFKNGFQAGLKKCGLSSCAYPVELYVWVTSGDDKVCPDCLRRSRLRPMDIAEWMKIGLPRTPEAETCCGARCRCRLVKYNLSDSFHF